MKVFELIEALKLMPQDLEVYGSGQLSYIPEKIDIPKVVFTNDLLFQIEDYHAIMSYNEEYGYTEKFVLL